MNSGIRQQSEGIASTASAAMLNNRKFIGSELDQAVFEQGNKRLEDIEHHKIYRNILPLRTKPLHIITGGELE